MKAIYTKRICAREKFFMIEKDTGEICYLRHMNEVAQLLGTWYSYVRSQCSRLKEENGPKFVIIKHAIVRLLEIPVTDLKLSVKCPGEGWKMGLLPMSDDFIPLSKKSAVVGLWWNNGLTNKRSEECPGDGWQRGRLRNKRS